MFSLQNLKFFSKQNSNVALVRCQFEFIETV